MTKDCMNNGNILITLWRFVKRAQIFVYVSAMYELCK